MTKKKKFLLFFFALIHTNYFSQSGNPFSLFFNVRPTQKYYPTDTLLVAHESEHT